MTLLDLLLKWFKDSEYTIENLTDKRFSIYHDNNQIAHVCGLDYYDGDSEWNYRYFDDESLVEGNIYLFWNYNGNSTHIGVAESWLRFNPIDPEAFPKLESILLKAKEEKDDRIKICSTST